MARILGFDLETTVVEPFDATKMRITEIGAILWCTEKHKPLQIFSQSVWAPDYVWHPKMEEITGLTEAEHKEFGVSPAKAIQDLFALFEKAEAIVAHNGKNFDKVVLEHESNRHFLLMPINPWVDSMSDIPYPKKIETRKLEFLGPSHGFLNPFSHRAIFDVLSMLKVLSHYDFKKVFALSKEPDVIVKATIAPPFGNTAERGKKETAEAKTLGFKFDKTGSDCGLPNTWWKRIKEGAYSEEAKNCPWPIAIIKQ